MFAFLAQPLTWAVAGIGGLFGAWLNKPANPTVPVFDAQSQGVNWNQIIFYSAAALALAYGFKKVF